MLTFSLDITAAKRTVPAAWFSGERTMPRLASPGWLTVQRRSVGFVLALERLGDALTPVTFYRVKR